ncbi:MAG TPA: ABC transporter permease [Candidatus Hydrogenedentes bacterium]|nr:ABC transporter permease [Candidatus Hydrogenedentota bacterium]
MIRRIWIGYCVELTKAARRKFTYVGPAVVLASVVGLLLQHPIGHNARSDYGYIAFATSSTLDVAGLAILLVFVTAQVAGEFSSGAIRLTLVRPILRYEYLAAKTLLGMTYAVVLTLLTAVGAWTVAFAFGDILGVSFGGDMRHATGEMGLAYAYGVGLALLPQWASVAYAVFIATLVRGTGAAMGTAAGIWILVEMIKYRLKIAPFLFSSYLQAPWQPFTDMANGFTPQWMPMAWSCSVVSVGAFVLFFALAVLALYRRNLQA